MQKTEPPAERPQASPRNQALRLIFEYEGQDVRLVSVQRVRMIPPPPQAALPQEPAGGSWVELRDGSGQPVYRRVLHNPIGHDMEVVAEEPDEPLQRIRVKRPQGAFHLVVPDIAAARSVALRAEPSGRASGRKAAAAAETGLFEFQLPGSGKEG